MKIAYPESINKLGAEHRRQYSYLDLPKLYDALDKAEFLLCEYLTFSEKIKSSNNIVDLTLLKMCFERHYMNCWIDYYGIDAQDHLIKYYNRGSLQWLHEQRLQALSSTT